MRRSRKLFFTLLAVLITALVGLLISIQYVNSSTRTYRYSDINSVPAHRVALVFGALISSRGEPSPILKDRIQTAVDLYKAGKVQKILMSGDNRTADYNEVYAMQQYALSQGVPDADITLDYAGLSTYDSCYRAHDIFGLDDAILVTQRYHLPRALYACRHLGIDAVGVEIPDWERYPDIKDANMLREELATVKMLWDIHILHPGPAISGKFEGIK